MSEEEPEPRTLTLKADSRQTEMGFEVTVHSPAVNLRIELDLDYDPEYALALFAMMPQIIDDQMQRYTTEGETG